MKNEMKNELSTMVKESGLDKNRSQYILDNFQNYFDIAAEWEEKAKAIKVTNAEQTAEMQMARTGRLFLRRKRIAVEKARKKLKEQPLRESKAIDGVANVLKSLIIPIEEYLKEQEKFIEIQEEKKREAERIEAEKKEEEKRIKQEKIQKLHQERREILLPYKQWWEPELHDTNLGELSKGNFDNILSSLKQEKEDYDKEQERIRKENKRLQKERQEKERKARKEREAHEKALAEERKKAEAEKQKHEEKLRKEQEKAKREKEKAEAKAKAEQERIKKEAETKAEKERKRREASEKKLKNQITCPNCGHKFQLKEKNKGKRNAKSSS